MVRGIAVPALLLLLVAGVSWGQSAKPTTLAELAVYAGADREQLLLAGAKKEGKVVWYTALAGGSYKDLARAFETKYGVPVEAYRGASRDLIAKVLAESQAKRYLMDVAESSPPLLMLMRAMKRLTPFSSPHLAKFSADAKEDAGKGTVFWATDRESYMGFAYNKEKLPASAVPKNYEGLLNPALKGRMAFVTTDTGSRTVGAMLRTKGEEFLRRLRSQDITMHSISGQAMNDLIITGEVEASPTIFRNHALVAAEKKGAMPMLRRQALALLPNLPQRLRNPRTLGRSEIIQIGYLALCFVSVIVYIVLHLDALVALVPFTVR